MHLAKIDLNTFIASSMISGTCIGAGMLALPASAGQYGFLPTILIMAVACFFMTLGGLYMADACLASRHQDPHLISLSDEYLGPQAKALSWVVYLLIGITSFVAYVSEGGKILTEFLNSFQIPYKHEQGYVAYLLFYVAIIATGSKWVSRVNATLFSMLLFSFVGLISILIPNATTGYLFEHSIWTPKAFSMLPLMLTIFSFPGIVPGITKIVQYDPNKLKKAIVTGTSMGFVLYSIWLMIVMSVIPSSGPFGLSEIYAMDRSVTKELATLLSEPVFSMFVQIFGLLAITTSFIGVGWALTEFLMDGLKLSGRRNHILIVSVVGGLTYTIIGRFDQLFFLALETSGGIGDSLISGIIPALMVFTASRRQQKSKTNAISFSRSNYFWVCLFFLFVMINEFYQLIG